MQTSPGHCGHFGHRDAWFQWDKSMISAKRVLWKIFECRVCQFSRPPRLWIDTRPSRMAIYVQMAIPNSISHTNSIRKQIPDRFSDFSVIAISLQYWSCLPYLCMGWRQGLIARHVCAWGLRILLGILLAILAQVYSSYLAVRLTTLTQQQHKLHVVVWLATGRWLVSGQEPGHHGKSVKMVLYGNS